MNLKDENPTMISYHILTCCDTLCLNVMSGFPVCLFTTYGNNGGRREVFVMEPEMRQKLLWMLVPAFNQHKKRFLPVSQRDQLPFSIWRTLILAEFPIVSFTHRIIQLFRASIADFRYMKPEIKFNFVFVASEPGLVENRVRERRKEAWKAHKVS